MMGCVSLAHTSQSALSAVSAGPPAGTLLEYLNIMHHGMHLIQALALSSVLWAELPCTLVCGPPLQKASSVCGRLFERRLLLAA